ncbi:hypothetical protein [Phenylobacterium sp.]|uniref:hypothetical protein n=1 Tax=Phenylobacterium sp. TaxID=1871053 RepID=UPI00356376A3
MERDLSTPTLTHETQSAVSWGAVLAGAVAALAISFVLLGLAAGFGLKLASPWPGAHPALTDFTPILGAWMLVVQVLASALGGYLAGRLRTKWLNVHTHEVHFRDTAHGLLVWAVSTIAGVILAATLLAPPAEIATAAAAAAADPAVLQLAAARHANIAAQFSLFMAVGLLLGAFTASVAAAIGGLRRDEMHTMFWGHHGTSLRG